MSSQSDDGIPFGVSNSLEEVRLLELPPALLKVLKSGTNARLCIKSGIAQTDEGGKSDAAHAVLCTKDQTFQIRQVQSSNSIFVLKPSNIQYEDLAALSPSTAGVLATSQCASTLELVPASPSGEGYLKKHLPTYERKVDRPQIQESGGNGQEVLFANAPLSENELIRAWTKLCCFELDGQAYVPSDWILRQVWDSILSAATIGGIRLDEPFSTDVLVSRSSEAEAPVALLQAVLSRLRTDSEPIQDLCEGLDPGKCVEWVGDLSLKGSQVPVLLSEFMQIWQDRLPERWRGQAKLEVLTGKYSQPSKTTISFDPTGEMASSASAAPITTAKSNRKWHEKFKNTKR